MTLLGSQPGIGHLREDLTRRPVKFWPVYSYLIVYDPETKHGNRDIGEILN